MQNPDGKEILPASDQVSEEVEQTTQNPAAPITSQVSATIQWPSPPFLRLWATGTSQRTPGFGQQRAPQQQLNPTEDPDFAFSGPEPGDPLYISPVDSLELKLITLQLAGPDHYSTWARDIRRALVTKDKDGFLDGSVPLPVDDRMQRHWRRCNHLVRTWLGNCVTAEVAARLPPTEDAKTMWENIREMYGKLDLVKVFSLTQALTELKQGNLSVTACFNRLSALWNELEAVEGQLEGPETTIRKYREIKEREKVIRFLLALNDSWIPFRSRILAMKPVPPLGRIFELAVQEENQRLATIEQERGGESIMLAAIGKNLGRSHGVFRAS